MQSSIFCLYKQRNLHKSLSPSSSPSPSLSRCAACYATKSWFTLWLIDVVTLATCSFSHSAVTPKHGPQITGGQPRYQIGDMVRVNCTSAPSKPVCHLSWLINGMHANRSLLRPYEPRVVGREGLEVARLGLEFRVRG